MIPRRGKKMALLVAILSLLAALVPIADRGIQSYRASHGQPIPVVRATTPDQPTIVFYHGEWWKYENNQWLVWRPVRQTIAQGGERSVRH